MDGQHYFFVSEEEFDELIATGGLLEWAVVHRRHRYGTPAAPVAAAVAEGHRVILEIDLQGARQIRQHLPGARFVFIAPPSRQALLDRLSARGTEGAEEQARRMVTADAELAAQAEFDHVVVNDDLGQAVQDLVGLLGL